MTRDNFVAHDKLGVELDRRGRPEEALAQYREALRIRPGDRNASENVAQANFAAGAACWRSRSLRRPWSASRRGCAQLLKS
ncbi:MAG TPA: tetratricopeptide repeat protein [Bryobacteraceae bacterium]|nr:tetratricopeptide repeat protein [Bryobacteraceae bacterium]